MHRDKFSPMHLSPKTTALAAMRKPSISRPGDKQERADNWPERPDVRVGSKPEVAALQRDVCFEVRRLGPSSGLLVLI